MALQVWLPLNGKNENQGISGVAINGSPASWGNGPIGKCGVFTGQKISIPYDIDSEQLTITFWFYPDTPDAWCDVFSIGAGDNRFEVSRTTRYYWYADKTPLISSGSVLGEFSNNKWYHIGFVITGEQCLLYINGTLQNKYTQTNQLSTVLSGNRKIMLMSRIAGNNTYNGSIADFRIYDNALSPKEVHEIAQGLCCHYPLNDPYATGSINKYSGDNFEGKPSGSSYTVTKLANERGYNYKLSYTGTGNNTWPNFYFPTFSFTAGKTYDYSCKVRCHSKNFNIDFRAAHISNDWVTSMKTITVADNQWHEYHIQIKLDAKYTRSGTEYNTKPLVEFYSESLATKDMVYTCDFDLKDVCVSECSTAASGSNGSWADNTVYDTSGMGNHGSVTSACRPVLAGNSPMYDKCYEFPYKNYITGKMPFGGQAASNFTISIWLNQIEGGAYSTWLNSNGYGDSGLWLAVNTEGCAQWGYRGSVSPNYVKGGSNIAVNTWHLFTYVYKEGVATWYLDGKKNCSATYADKTIMPAGTFTLGDSYAGSDWNTNFHGKLSDFRIYATALSDEDIAELYNTPVSITSTGTMMTKGELIET